MATFGVYLTHKYDPPFEDWWAFKMIDHDMKELSAELLGLSCPLPPLVGQMSRCLDQAITKRNSYWESATRNIAPAEADRPEDPAARIARLLGEHDHPPIIDGAYGANGREWCYLCNGEGEQEEGHDADCPWRLARELAREKVTR